MRQINESRRSKSFLQLQLLGVVVLLLSLMPNYLLGQMTARGLGMGGAYTALARGVHAPVYNPANLGLPDNSRFSFTFISLEAGVWNNSFTNDQYNQYNGALWTSQDIEDIMNSIPDDGLTLDVKAFARAFSFSVGRFAISIGADAGSFTRLDKTFFQLPLQGNELNETYEMDDTDGEAMGIGRTSLSWGQPVNVSFADAFAVGLTVHFIYGGAYGHVDKAYASFTTADYGMDIDADYEVKYALGGLGWGLDLGTAAQFNEKWTVSLSLGNVIGSIPWSREVNTEIGYVHGDSLGVIDFDEDVIDSSWTIEGNSFSNKPPIVLRLGCAFKEGPVVITADYCQGFREGAWVSTKPRFALGTEWSGVSWLPLRVGVVMGGRVGFGTSFGFGIRPGGFVLDIGVMNRGFVTPGKSKGVIVAVELGIDLQKKKSDVVRVGDF